MDLIAYAAELAWQASSSGSDLRAVGFELMIHSAGGLIVLFVPVVLSVYKPGGLTSYGKRMQQKKWCSPEKQLQSPSVVSSVGIRVLPKSGSVSVSLRYSHLAGIAVAVLITHFVILHLMGIGLGGG
jgi:hypothetical protein